MAIASEFRLGNWFKSPTHYQQITIEHLEYLLNEKLKPHSAINPIPLTPEILEKCGFKLIGEPPSRGGDYYYKNGVSYRLSKNKSLHWLQNYYYFNYNGEELEIKL